MTKRIQGDWLHNGYLAGREPLIIEIDVDGGLHDPRDPADEPLRCEQWGLDSPVITNGCWTFAPDDGELARIGVTPVQMIPR
jgi:hypothetical protein